VRALSLSRTIRWKPSESQPIQTKKKYIKEFQKHRGDVKKGLESDNNSGKDYEGKIARKLP